jgi:predicted site-specific integrase-resolvase
VIGAEEPPADRLTYAQAAVLLGVHPRTVARMIRRGELADPLTPMAGLLRSDVERLSLARWRPGDRTWLTTAQVGEQLGLSRARVYQLSNAGTLPYQCSGEGRRLFRPGQIAVIARAREVRLQRGNRPAEMLRAP